MNLNWSRETKQKKGPVGDIKESSSLNCEK